MRRLVPVALPLTFLFLSAIPIQAQELSPELQALGAGVEAEVMDSDSFEVAAHPAGFDVDRGAGPHFERLSGVERGRGSGGIRVALSGWRCPGGAVRAGAVRAPGSR